MRYRSATADGEDEHERAHVAYLIKPCRDATTPVPPALAVFREGTRGRWRPATRITATAFEAKVHGPYMVRVV
jgi:hypothetical protein